MFSAIIKENVQAYRKASSKEKTAIVTSVVTVSGMHRKAVIRALNRELTSGTSRQHSTSLGRPRMYTAECEAALAFVWEQYEHPSAERLHSELTEAVRIFKRDGMWQYSEAATAQLLGMSLGAMKQRTVTMAKKRGLLRGISTTRSSEILRSVPVFYGPWSEKGVGYGQIDTVVHSGPKLMGTMAYTVNYVDVATYWQEPVAQLDKTAIVTLASIHTIARRLPWRVKGFHPDSGGEFINEAMVDWANKRGVELTRSRSGKKNDNAFVEQRNLVVVRKYVGYERYDCQEAVDAMNELYTTLRLYVNFFQPTFKLQYKEKRPNGGYKRIYDTSKTPYARVLERKDVSKRTKDTLTRQYETLNPKRLRERIQTLTTNLERIQRELGYHF
jgi:hypothetical protein